MKAFNIISLALGGAALISMGAAVVLGAILPHDVAMPITLVISFVVGFNARRTAEKILGYTLEDALKEGKDE